MLFSALTLIPRQFLIFYSVKQKRFLIKTVYVYGYILVFFLLNGFNHAIYQLKYHELQINVMIWGF